MAQGHHEIERVIPGSAPARERTDLELVAEVLRKDRKATAEFVARHTDHVYAYVRRRLAPRIDLVEDVVQEIFLAAWESLHKFRADSSLRSWILGIARHKIEDHYRQRLRELHFQEEDEIQNDEPLDFVGIEETLEQQRAGERVRETMAKLPEVYSVILQWRYWEKRSLRDIAAQTGKTEKAIERLLARARHQFKKRWNERAGQNRR
jgi:RNA polymerase sigma-70 factor, ECF subfamily